MTNKKDGDVEENNVVTKSSGGHEINSDLSKLIDITTVVKAEQGRKRVLVYGDEENLSVFNTSPKAQQIDLKKLEVLWKKKWATLGNVWNQERQMYRFFYEAFRLFYYSFYQLQKNKIELIQTVNDRGKGTYLCAVNLYGVYHHGKKCIDLLKNMKLVNTSNMVFCDKFSQTRNKFFEHNQNPKHLKIQNELFSWGVGDTSSFLEINVHGAKENEFTVYIDYFQDYFNLENIITDTIKNF